MRLAIACHEMYEDLALHIKEELVKVFTADDWGKYSKDGYSYTPQALVDPDGLECFDNFKFIKAKDDVFEMYIKGGPTGDNHISVWSKEKVGRIPTFCSGQVSLLRILSSYRGWGYRYPMGSHPRSSLPGFVRFRIRTRPFTLKI